MLLTPSPTWRLQAGLVIAGMAMGPFVTATSHRPAYDVSDPATWSAQTLAAQLTVSCLDLPRTGKAAGQAAAGIGGITLLGGPPRAGLPNDLLAARRSAAHGLQPFVMSDEEGGAVQRLRTLIYRLPSAKTMGGWRPRHVKRTAQDYAVRMRRLGVQMDLAPVADLAIPGYYIDGLRRAFSRDPVRVAARARAWRRGMASADVATVLKHWPGHGQATNSHTGPARVPPLSVLERRDMIPFDTELASGARVVMVGHLLSTGLTTRHRPASESHHALHYLRAKAGPDVVIMTDSLSMAAASSSLGISPSTAAIRALRAGADWALVCNRHPLHTTHRIRDAIKAGTIPRAQAVASARRILQLKQRFGLTPG